CVPSKNLIRAAESLHKSQNNTFAGIETEGRISDFKAIMQQKRDLVGQLQQQKYVDVIRDIDGIRQIIGRATLSSPKSVEVNGETITGDFLLVATGARPNIPDIDGLKDVHYLTNESAFELDERPKSLIVLGGRYIALEIAQMFSRLGSKVTILQRSERILPTETADITDALTAYLEDEGIKVVTNTQFQKITKSASGIMVASKVNGTTESFTADQIIIATGRTPNSDNMGLESIGVELKPDGGIKVNDQLTTSISSVYAVGDVLNENMFVYTAAYEGKLAARNALLGETGKRDYNVLPWVIFTDPQVTGVGLDERQAQVLGINAETSVLPMEYVPRALAARDTRGMIKLIRDADTDRIIGARILAPEGSEMIMEIALAIKNGVTVKALIEMFHPYLTNAEGIKLAALTFEKDVKELSCCAT
ncbi:MAG: mercury(II) reductase, partial [Candidatus Marinimicrobia bacterium]|nr:mercury(II) reductase [Candidatus Neomarinimicrobiota bacterium]